MKFDKFAGQLTASGIAPGMPINALEEGYKSPSDVFHGLLPKISRVFIEETRIFGDRFGGLIQTVDDPFGAGIEIAGFVGGATNRPIEGCVPFGDVPMTSQVAYTNFAYNIPVMVGDREINRYVTDAETAGAYAAQKLRTPLKTVAQMRYSAWKQLLSGVIDGTRSITSNTRSDNLGDAVTYTADVEGYVSEDMLGLSNIIVPAPGIGERPTIGEQEALEMVLELRGAVRDMATETTENNALGIENFTVGNPMLVIEEKVLDALDEAWSISGGYQGMPSVSARQFLGGFADMVEIDKFPDLPTNATYEDYRLGAVLVDRDGLREIVKQADVESERCVNQRATGYSYQGESIFAIWRGAPAFALLVKPGD